MSQPVLRQILATPKKKEPKEEKEEKAVKVKVKVAKQSKK